MAGPYVEGHVPTKVAMHLEAARGFDAFELWHASLSSLFFDASLAGEDDAQARFHGTISGFHLGTSLIFRSASIAHRHARDPSLVRRSAIDHVMIEYQIEGRRGGDFSGRSVDINPGDVSFIDFGRTLRSEEPDFSRISLIVPRDRLPASLRERDLHGLVLDKAQTTTRTLARFLIALTDAAGALPLDACDDAVDTALALAQNAIKGPITPSLEERPAARLTLRHAARTYIEEQLLSPNLTPAEIASAVGMSRATLYRLFEPDGGVRGYVLERRLDRSLEAILSTKGRTSIGDIAFAHMFESEAHFSRAFRRRFGISPRDVRAVARKRQGNAAEVDAGPAALTLTRDWVRDL